jgi:hypothetical protein
MIGPAFAAASRIARVASDCTLPRLHPARAGGKPYSSFIEKFV